MVSRPLLSPLHRGVDPAGGHGWWKSTRWLRSSGSRYWVSCQSLGVTLSRHNWTQVLKPCHLGINLSLSLKYFTHVGFICRIAISFWWLSAAQIYTFPLRKPSGDFPDGQVVKKTPCNAGDMGSVPGWGTRIPHALE